MYKINSYHVCDIYVQKKSPETIIFLVLSKEEGEKTEVMADDSASCCLIGSLSSQYGGDTSILYSQWDLHTREQKVNQIVLLKVMSSLICITAVTLSWFSLQSQPLLDFGHSNSYTMESHVGL